MLRISIVTLMISIAVIPAYVYAIDEDEIRVLVENKTIDMYHKKKDVEYKRFFAKDGTLMELHSENGFRKGSWSIDGEKLCFVLDGASAKCRPVMEKGGKYGTGNKKGSKMMVKFTGYEDGNTLDIPKEQLSKLAGSKQAKEELITLNTRDDVTQTFLLIEPEEEPKGVVIIYPGHEGVVRFKKVGNHYSVENEGGGLTAQETSRHIYSQQGFVVALLAPPSDRLSGMDTTFRSSDEHAQDAKKVIEYLHDKYNHKAYLHGHCRSTFSPAAVATKLNNEGILGLILSSTRSEGKHGGVVDYEKGKVKVPVLLVQHVNDPCEGTLYKNMPKVKSFYEQSTKVSVITVDGGDGSRPANAPGCSGGYHSYKGLQKPVMKAIVNWINNDEFSTHISDK